MWMMVVSCGYEKLPRLAGDAAEWTLDWYVDPYPYALTCNDCAYLTASPYRVFRGGSFV